MVAENEDREVWEGLEAREFLQLLNMTTICFGYMGIAFTSYFCSFTVYTPEKEYYKRNVKGETESKNIITATKFLSRDKKKDSANVDRF